MASCLSDRTVPMKRTGALFFSAVIACTAAEPRYLRLGELEGAVQTRVKSSAEWKPALRNQPLTQGFQMRTGAAARVEIEFDDGGALRLGPDSVAELCDVVRLATGQRITLVAIDSGLAYYTGEPDLKDSFSLLLPGGQVALRRGARLRLEAAGDTGQVAVLEGEARLIVAAAEFDLREGQTARVSAAQGARFQLYREVVKMDLDGWSEQRDRVLAGALSANHSADLRYGLADLDAHGAWIETAEFGPAWKPAVPAAWAPFRSGKWVWYDGLGYTWIAAEPWGWLPYHFGRWTRLDPVGWVWAPGRRPVFSPGDVYWMRAPGMAGWGPLAPGEIWNGKGTPQLYLNAHTTFAKFQAGMREIDPEGFAGRPRDPLATASFALALVSPPVAPARSGAETPRAAEVRFFRPGPVREAVAAASEAPSQPEPPGSQTLEQVIPQPQPAPAQGYVAVPVPQYEDSYYVAPVYTGIVVVNPPERHDRKHHQPPEPAKPAQPPAPATPATPPAPVPRPGIPRADRNEIRRSPETPAQRSGPERPADRVPRAEPGSGSKRSQ